MKMARKKRPFRSKALPRDVFCSKECNEEYRKDTTKRPRKIEMRLDGTRASSSWYDWHVRKRLCPNCGAEVGLHLTPMEDAPAVGTEAPANPWPPEGWKPRSKE